MAAERGMNIEEFYAAMKSDPALERSIDDRQAKLMCEKDGLVIQGRVAWFFAKQSPFKKINILLTVDPEIGAQRVAERKENAGKSIEEVAVATTQRTHNERERYQMLYGIEDYFDPAHYDIVLDTSHMTAEKVFQNVIDNFNRRNIFP